MKESTLNPKIYEEPLTCYGDTYFLSFWDWNNHFS